MKLVKRKKNYLELFPVERKQIKWQSLPLLWVEMDKMDMFRMVTVTKINNRMWSDN